MRRLLILALLLMLAPTTRADEPARGVVLSVVGFVAKAANREGMSLRVSLPVAPRVGIAGLDPETLQRLLEEELTARRFKIDAKAGVELSIDYSKVRAHDSGTGLSSVLVHIVLAGLGKFEYQIDDPAYLKQLTAVESPLAQLAVPELARKVAALLAVQRADSVVVEPISGPSNSGLGTSLDLARALRSRKIKTPLTGSLHLTTSLRLHEEANASRSRAVLEAILRDGKTHKELASCRAETFLSQSQDGVGVVDFLVIRGDNHSFDPATKPTPPSHPSIARVGAAPFGVELLVADKPVLLVEGEAQPIVKLGEKDEYAIRLHNDSPYAAAVDLRIDGLSLFAFDESGAKPSAVVIPAKSSVVVRGWYRSSKLASRFTVTRYDNSNLPPASSTQKVGSITAVFRYAWKKGEVPPPGDEKKGAMRTSTVGEAIKQNVQLVEMKMGMERGAITVRYLAKEDR
jgi:hypothetical protein